MKLKDLLSPFILLVIGSAFILISLIGLLINGQNKKFIYSKMRLGAFLLSFSWFISGCDGGSTNSYEPVIPYNVVTINQKDNVEAHKNHYSPGDTVSGTVYEATHLNYSFELVDSVSKNTKQSGFLMFDSVYNKNENYHFVINTNLDSGTYNLNFFALDSLPTQKYLLNSNYIIYIKF